MIFVGEQHYIVNRINKTDHRKNKNITFHHIQFVQILNSSKNTTIKKKRKSNYNVT